MVMLEDALTLKMVIGKSKLLHILSLKNTRILLQICPLFQPLDAHVPKHNGLVKQNLVKTVLAQKGKNRNIETDLKKLA